MLKVENLSTSYKLIDGDVHVLNDLNFEIHDNEIFGIAGESGCGKTTLLKTLYDIIEFPLEIDKGKVILSGEKNGQSFSYESGNIQKTWWNNISYVPQAAQSVLNPIVRLKKQFLDSIPQEDRKNETKEQTLARVAKYLEELNLSPDILESYPFQLSGGMRQRVMIAMALSCNPKLIIADEPTTALDVTIQAQILQLIRDLQKELGMSVIYITHDLGVVANVADRVAVMYAGQIVEYGTVEEIFYDAWHPYTWALLQALPQLGTKGEALPTIDGTPPNLFNEIKGDAFAPRNKHALAIDFVAEPPFFQVSETHAAKTWYLDPRAPKMERPHSIQNLREKMGKMGGSNFNG